MAQLTLELPDQLVASLRAEAAKRHTTAEELLARHVVSIPPKPSETPHRTAASFWGAGGKGPGTHGSAEAVDAYIRELREEWD